MDFEVIDVLYATPNNELVPSKGVIVDEFSGYGEDRTTYVIGTARADCDHPGAVQYSICAERPDGKPLICVPEIGSDDDDIQTFFDDIGTEDDDENSVDADDIEQAVCDALDASE